MGRGNFDLMFLEGIEGWLYDMDVTIMSGIF